MRTYLVTGATGFIGRRVVHELSMLGHHVKAVARPNSSLVNLPSHTLDIVRADLASDDNWGRAVDNVDVVIHLASVLKMPWRPDFESINVQGTRRIVQHCLRARRPPRFILVSSLSAAGPAMGGPHIETMMPAPISIYGRTKLAVEHVVRTASAKLSAAIVRPPMVFGPGDNATLSIFKSILRGVHVVPRRTDFGLSTIYVDDLARGLIAVAEAGERLDTTDDPEKRSAGLYYLAMTKPTTYAALGRLIAHALGVRDPTTIWVPPPIGRGAAWLNERWARMRGTPAAFNLDKWRESVAGDWVCSPRKAVATINWSAAYPLAQRLRHTVEGYRQAGLLMRSGQKRNKIN
ncbi:MAG: NAD-dependent epimerase/dehydratase family protein [Myxococcota bacterium]|nr:NAD-dependent epimerase/dehydratase family protein [Myxococcota bacterium]